MLRLVTWAAVGTFLALPARPQNAADLFLQQLDGVEKKFVDLAEAIPEAKYGWRPAEGVRSVSEVFMHVAGGNFRLPSFAGVKPPEGVSRDMEKQVTAKADVIAKLKESFTYVHSAGKEIGAGDLGKSIKLFGGESTPAALLMLIANHQHEHLGQMIAYARMNGIAPPWSR